MSAFSPRPDYESGNGFLYAVLGLVRASLEVDAFVEAAARTAEPGAAVQEDASAGAARGSRADDDLVTLALLGLVSLGKTLRSTAESWSDVPVPEAPQEGETAVRRVKDLLR